MPKSVLVTGAAKGIGLEIARELGRRGWHVLLGARDAKRGEEAVAVLRAGGARVDFVALDLTNEKSITAAARTVALLVPQLDVLINNAAILTDHYQPMSATTRATLRETLETNVTGTHLVTCAFLPLLRKAPAARIVNVPSGAGQLCDMAESIYAPAYQISKTALNALTCLFACELKEAGIAVNTLDPGWCQTDMGGEGATHSARHGADTAVWLAADAPQELTGKFLRDRQEIPW